MMVAPTHEPIVPAITIPASDILPFVVRDVGRRRDHKLARQRDDRALHRHEAATSR